MKSDCGLQYGHRILSFCFRTGLLHPLRIPGSFCLRCSIVLSLHPSIAENVPPCIDTKWWMVFVRNIAMHSLAAACLRTPTPLGHNEVYHPCAVKFWSLFDGGHGRVRKHKFWRWVNFVLHLIYRCGTTCSSY